MFRRLPRNLLATIFRPSTTFASLTPGPFISARMASSLTLPQLPIFEAIAKHDPKSTAIIHSLSGRRFTYGELLSDVAERKEAIVSEAGVKSLNGERVAFLVENSYDYVVTILALFANHAIAVPMSPSFPSAELEYIVENSQSIALLSTERYKSKAEEVLKHDFSAMSQKPAYIFVEKHKGDNPGRAKPVELRSTLSKHEGGMMLHTSGTTSRPKGVLLQQSVLTAQCKSLYEAWDYSNKDHLLHVLPLHHIHGVVNALLTPLFAGSTIELLFPFNVDKVYERFAAPFQNKKRENSTDFERITFWTVVPTIYQRLLATFPSLPQDIKDAAQTALKRENLRLNISGSAALPLPTKKAWNEISHDNVLLERFGMTEVGMALSCGLANEDRVDGSVGWPLPSVEIRLVDPETQEEIKPGEETSRDGKEREGEIQLRGPTVFTGYWRNDEANKKEFVPASDGSDKAWFKTGDVAVRRNVDGAGTGKSGAWAKGPCYFIKGRSSTDIIKTGGEKVSALEIERELLSLPEVAEAAVVGVADEKWGQKVAAVLVLTEQGKTAGKGGKEWGPMDMRRALKEKLVNYKVPQELRIVESIPKNAMGKVNKKSLVKEIFPAASG